MKEKIAIFSVPVGLIATPVFAAAANCELTSKEPMPMDQTIKAAQALGFKDISEAKLERGCYEMEGKNKDGKFVDFNLNAGTGDLASERSDYSKSLLK